MVLYQPTYLKTTINPDVYGYRHSNNKTLKFETVDFAHTVPGYLNGEFCFLFLYHAIEKLLAKGLIVSENSHS